ncbi:MAG: hypothetical protein IJ461_08530 [Clostridia bacterium]|nr:hypothetical protein [Clostridia bacterium]
MAKKWMLAALVAVVALGLTACATRSPEGDFQVATQKPVGMPVVQETPVPTVENYDPGVEDWDNVDYDPAAEDEAVIEEFDVVEATVYPYAGATPMPLDPIDKPTATPRVPLTFANYQVYNASKLGLSFEGPVGWLVDDAVSDTFTITDPEIRDDYQAYMTVSARNVGGTYSATDLRDEVRAMLSSIGSKNYTSWKPSTVDDRRLMGLDGKYANYRGTLVDGTNVRGRIAAICSGNTLITVHMSVPANFNSDYLDGVYKKLETTLSETR